MITPTIGTLVVTRLRRPTRGIRRATGLRLGAPGTRWGWYYAAAWIIIPILVLGALVVSAALGLYHADLTNFSGYRAALEDAGVGKTLDQISIQNLVAIQMIAVLFAPLLNGVFTFGEEWGWRGYLLPALLPLGQWRALLLSGAIWGFWHAPILWLGYNYPQHPQLGVVLFIVFCALFGTLLGWTRLATGSVWPAVIGHAALNGSAGSYLLFVQAGTAVDTAQATIIGWVGWLILAAAIGALVLTRQLPVRHAPDAIEPALPNQEAGSSTNGPVLDEPLLVNGTRIS
jgi:membrane protease YdiL (CAAX protease family)